MTIDQDLAEVHAAIIKTVLPQLYAVIDDLIDAAGKPIPKDLLIRARRLLPAQYRNSFGRPKGDP